MKALLLILSVFLIFVYSFEQNINEVDKLNNSSDELPSMFNIECEQFEGSESSSSSSETSSSSSSSDGEEEEKEESDEFQDHEDHILQDSDIWGNETEEIKKKPITIKNDKKKHVNICYECQKDMMKAYTTCLFNPFSLRCWKHDLSEPCFKFACRLQKNSYFKFMTNCQEESSSSSSSSSEESDEQDVIEQ